MFDATHISVLHYLVAHMETNLPGALELEEEEAALKEAAKKGSLDASAWVLYSSMALGPLFP
jgi:hypothetical protein